MRLFKAQLMQSVLVTLCMFISMSMSYGQRTIQGTVTDAGNGETLIGASVLVGSTGEGTSTDIDGTYSIQAETGDILTFSYVGYADMQITVGTSDVIDVAMQEGELLDEVIVTGYTTQTRGDVTGSVASVDLLEATKAPLVNVAEALEGRVSGVTLINNGNPGAAPTIRIRGLGTTNNNNPLFIIDGVQTTDGSVLNSINPNDIAQMNVLKDGAASIYGARASNGVVIVTTKSGKYNQSNPVVSLNVYTGTSQATNLPGILNSQQHGDMIFESLANDGVATSHPQYGSGATAVVPSTLSGTPFPVTANAQGTNWLDEIYQNARTENVDFSVSNGGESSKYSFSMGYLNREGVQLTTGFKRGMLRLNSEFKAGKRLTVGEHINLSFSNSRGGNLTQRAMRMNPLIPVRDNEGNFAGTYTASAGLGNSTNPVADLLRGGDNFFKQTRILGDIYAKVKIIDGLTFKTSIGGDINSFNDRGFTPLNPEHSEPRSTNTLSEQNQNYYNWVFSNTLNYLKDINKHSINVLVGTEATRNAGKGSGVQLTGFLFETPEFYTLRTGSGTPTVTFAFDNESTLSSIFGSINYSFDDKYFFTATLRNDKSSNFLPDNTGDIFPSFSAGWDISDEDFFPTGGAINSLKLKASWGQLGNQNVPVQNAGINISSLNIETANYPFGGTLATGAILSQVGNPNITWETSESTNIGLDFTFLNHDLYFSAEYFIIKTKDLIAQDFSLINDTAIDAGAPYVNLGSIENKGFDFSLGYSNETTSGFSYGIDATLSTYKNEVTDLVSEFQIGNATEIGDVTPNRTQVGQPIGEFYGRIAEGIYTSAAEVAAGPNQGFASDADGVGRIRYRDLNGDNIINDDDRTFIGSPHPDFTYGVNLSAGYKGFDLSAFFAGVSGNEIYNADREFTDFPAFFNGNRSTRVLNAFHPTNNPGGTAPALSSTILNNELSSSTNLLEDGSFLRLKNLQIGYTLPSSVTDKVGLSEARIYISGSNLFTITDYSGIDPEIQPGNGGNALTLGLDVNNFPLARTLLFGINLKF